MKDIPLFFSLGGGTVFIFVLFFTLFLGAKWEGQKAAIISMLVVCLLYFPLAVLYWLSLDIFAIHIALFAMTNYGLGVLTSIKSNSVPLEEGKIEEGQTTDAWFHIGSAVIISFFLLLTIVDSNTISTAKNNQSNLKIQNFYKTASQENLYQQQLKKQNKQGWKITGGWQRPPVLNQRELFIIHAENKLAKAIIGADVRLDLFSAKDTSKDRHITLKESSAGVYSQNIILPVDGKWTMLITVHKDDNLHEIVRQLEVPPEK